MENFKFELTNEQVVLLNQILEEEYKRSCSSFLSCKRSRSNLLDFFDSHVIDVATLIQELDIQSGIYLYNNGLNSFSDECKD